MLFVRKMENVTSTREFVVDTSNHCFLCRDKIAPFQEESRSSRLLDNPQSKNAILSTASPPLLKKYSLQYLSRYLEMDIIGNVFHDKDSIPSKLLTKVQRSNLKVSLCEKCAGWNSTMLELCRKLQKIQMEVNSYLELMYGQLLENEKDYKEGEVFCKTNDSVGAGPMGKLKVTRSLRLELKQKCFSKIRKTSPRVKIEKLNATDFPKLELLSKCKSESCNANQMTSSTPEAHCEEWMELGMASIYTPVKLEAGDDNEPLLMCVANNTDDTREGTNLNDMIWKEDPLDPPAKKVSVLETRHSTKVRKTPLDCPRAPSASSKNKCSICQKTFSSAANCDRHILELHSGVKFRCLNCNKLFTSKYSVHYHQRTSCGLPAHQRPRPFRCPTCGKGFADGKVLRRHVRIVHLKLGESKCDECGRTFSSPVHLKLHRKTVHLQIRDHGCDLCGYKFKLKYALQKHRRAVHKMID